MIQTDRVVRAYVAFAFKRPWVLLTFYALLTLGALNVGSGIDVNAELKSLLPEDAASVQAIEDARSRRGGNDQFVIAVTSPEPLQTVRFVDCLADELGDWEEVKSLDIERDQTFFREHALLYLPVDDLQQVKRNLQRIIRQRLGRSHPLFEDLESSMDAEEEEFEWRDVDLWINEYTLVELGIHESQVSNLFPFFESPEVEDTPVEEAEPTNEDREHARIESARQDLPDEYRDYRIAPHGRVAVFAANLGGLSTDIDYAMAAYERGETAINICDPAAFHPQLRAQVAGAYKSFEEVEYVIRDATRASQIAVGIIFFLMLVFFRNLRSIYIVLVPLLAGIVWTLGLLAVVYGELNTLTVFVFSMLIGMGIDFGIHIYRRIQEERRAGADWDEALFVAVARTGRALLTATVTTIVSLLTLTLASFDGFREFGVACGLGVGVSLLASVLIIPPLVAASEKTWKSREVRAVGDGAIDRGSSLPTTAARFGSVLVVIASLVGVVIAGSVEFEYNFQNLEGPRDPDRISYGAALGANRSSAPAVMLGESQQQMREVHEELRARLRSGAPLLRGFTTISTAVPPDMEARMEAIDEIYTVLDRRAVQRIDGDEGDLIQRLTDLTDVEPFGPEDLPPSVREMLQERDGSYGGLGMLYGEYRTSDAREVRAFQDAYQTIDVPSGTVRVSSNGFIISDVVRYVQADGKALAVYIALGLVLILFVDLRNIVGVLACLSGLAAAVAMTLGGMVLFHVKLGLYNIVVLPTVLGVGIDGAIHIYHRYLDEGIEALPHVMRTTGVAVIASSLTTAAGFVGLLFVEHKGVQTIGALGVLGIVCTLIAVVTLLPTMLALLGRGGGGDATNPAPPPAP